MREHERDFSKLNAQVLGISSDPPTVSRLLKEKNKLNFPLLCDSNREIAKKYKVAFTEHNIMGTGLFLVDKEGKVRFGKVSRPEELFPFGTIEELIGFLKGTQVR